MRGPGGQITLVPAATVTTAATVNGVAVPVEGLQHLLVEANFTYGSGGTAVNVYIQTRVKGATWRDVMNLNFTTASAKKWSKVSIGIALAAAQATSDAALAANTILDGFLGDEIRAKYVSTGTYADGTTIEVQGSAKY